MVFTFCTAPQSVLDLYPRNAESGCAALELLFVACHPLHSLLYTSNTASNGRPLHTTLAEVLVAAINYVRPLEDGDGGRCASLRACLVLPGRESSTRCRKLGIAGPVSVRLKPDLEMSTNSSSFQFAISTHLELEDGLHRLLSRATHAG